MTKIKPSLPKGTRDFGPTELRKRQYIFNTIKSVFEKYGFQPIETPVMENLSTLEGKYGEEGDKLLFRILNSGNPFSELSEEEKRQFLDFPETQKMINDLSEEYSKKEFNDDNDVNELKSKIKNQTKKLAYKLTEKGLRYDLTIPFARYVVMHQNEIAFPFKRYQIQPVWRADRPQKGRYREFYQCDADVVGSDSLLNEVELVLIYAEVFEKLGINVTIKINNRKILKGLSELYNLSDRFLEYVTIIDKVEKIGPDSVQKEMIDRGFNIDSVNNWRNDYDFFIQEKLDSQLRYLKKRFIDAGSDIGLQGIEEAVFVLRRLSSLSSLKVKDVLTKNLYFDFALARGLDYYTGTIFEVKANNVQMGSIGGGGRYDNLTGVFGLQGVSGVGISFGIERIYDVMEELGLFSHLNLDVATTKVMFVNFGSVSELTAFNYVQQIRAENISAEIYPANVKMDKQMKYANAKKISFVAFVGDEEIKNNTIQLKNMNTGEQSAYSIQEVIEKLKQ